MPTVNDILLSSSGLSCGYRAPEHVVLNDIDVELPAGRFICVIGPNGVGKTTLMWTLAGLLPAISGETKIGGVALNVMSRTERARTLSVVLTRLPIPGYLNVRAFVEIGRHPHTGILGRLDDSDRLAVDTAIRETGLTELANRWISTLSDGERQRAAIARALAQGAQIMILDEPTAFLDVQARAQVMLTLRKLAHAGDRAILASSHDVDLVLRTADQLWIILPSGELVRGSPEDLVLAGRMDDLFPDRSLHFDLDSGSYRLPPPAGPLVEVRGTGVVSKWTAHALERVGYRVQQRAPGSSGAPAPVIEARGERGGGSFSWTLSIGGHGQDHTSIGSVIESLRRQLPLRD